MEILYRTGIIDDQIVKIIKSLYEDLVRKHDGVQLCTQVKTALEKYFIKYCFTVMIFKGAKMPQFSMGDGGLHCLRFKYEDQVVQVLLTLREQIVLQDYMKDDAFTHERVKVTDKYGEHAWVARTTEEYPDKYWDKWYTPNPPHTQPYTRQTWTAETYFVQKKNL